MSFLRNLFGGKAKSEPKAEVERAECSHTRLAPKWDSAADMGKEDKITRFECESCRRTFSPEEGREIQATQLKPLEGG